MSMPASPSEGPTQAGMLCLQQKSWLRSVADPGAAGERLGLSFSDFFSHLAPFLCRVLHSQPRSKIPAPL